MGQSSILIDDGTQQYEWMEMIGCSCMVGWYCMAFKGAWLPHWMKLGSFFATKTLLNVSMKIVEKDKWQKWDRKHDSTSWMYYTPFNTNIYSKSSQLYSVRPR